MALTLDALEMSLTILLLGYAERLIYPTKMIVSLRGQLGEGGLV